ncbi:MAG: hypothetical protein P4L27_03335 [Ignavibacteriaceae bacterium]|nr:hypothetical protein [Ignavibacteriaceae bacterium]
MQNSLHRFHIPVMGLGFTVDTPIRVGPFGISSVISIVDDILIEKIRKYYSQKFNFPYTEITKKEHDSRAKRITEYLNLVQKIVQLRMEEIKRLPFFQENEKAKYFQMLPDESPLKISYEKLLQMKNSVEKFHLADHLTSMMRPGAIDVNIMAKVDKQNYDENGEKLGDEYSDAKSALRGFANSSLNSSVVFSAGFNRNLYGYIAQFSDFYRDTNGELKKKITIKVSDYRSALIQGKFLATKGLEVSEFRIESGLNCGGHAFASQGYLLPSLLNEFKEKRDQLTIQLLPIVMSFYKSKGWKYPESAQESKPLITVQGGIGTNGEARRMTEDFGCDFTGWGTPFLLVPEATCVDKFTLELLRKAKKEDQILSDVSPLGIPFNNLKMTSSELWTKERSNSSKPGSTCPKGFMKLSSSLTGSPLCMAANQYQTKVRDNIMGSDKTEEQKKNEIDLVSEKACLCVHLANGALSALNIVKENETLPKAVCPGPNIAWFDREYSLTEMVDHIYGRGDSLVSKDRPHMFSQEVELYVTYFEKLLKTMELNEAGRTYLKTFMDNLENGIDFILSIAERKPFEGENLSTVVSFVLNQRERLNSIRQKVFPKTMTLIAS